ncbi:hypothetical protein Tsubulata_024356 [Turnera subulata]|uniref:WRKY domain-containing protein n=1 Tax=Turnera subulata TaxID=218843 RepID=A0A9Q0G623_9ROSI|nr:hypothetical protein Tsubulata_024356 [Turnera subulata]
MEDDWDLHAVVRGCTSSSSSTTATAAASTATAVNTTTSSSTASSFRSDFGQGSCFSSFGSDQVGRFHSLPDPFEARNVFGELHDLYKPFFPQPQALYSPQSAPVSSVSSIITVSKGQHVQSHQLKQQEQPRLQSRGGGSVSSSASSHAPRSKRRKNQLKKICQVPAEALSSDVWAWRKYGQKPIKGSPYPRGYYRCSSSKGCLARKQVERNRSDPGMFIVTYTAEHNHPAPTHRNSLAGSTRQKTATPQAATTADDSNNKPSPAAKPTCSSPTTSLEDELLAQSTSREEKEMMEDDEEDELGGFSEAVSDDFFVGLEDLAAAGQAAAAGDSFCDPFPSTFGLPWLANNAATAAGSI